MRSHTKIRWTYAALALVVLLAACRDKKRPGPTEPDQPYLTDPSANVVLPAAIEAGFSFQGIGDLASTGSPRLSADGKTVAGTLNKRAVKWTAATGITPLGSLSGGDGTSTAAGISADGSVIVGSASSSRGTEAFRWTASTGMVGLGDLSGSGSFFSFALGVSADGATVVGMSSRLWPIPRAFRWTAATGLTALGSFPGGNGSSQAHAITPDGSVIVGSSSNSAGVEEAFRWTASGGLAPLGMLPGNGFTRAMAVSADAGVVVGMGAINIGMEGFRWTPATGVVGIGSLNPNDFASAALAVSADGNVITGIGSGAADFNGEAFVSFPGTGMLNLKQYLLNHGVSAVQGWTLGYGSAISADGRTIIGGAIDAQGKPATWIANIEIDNTPVPPPGSDTGETVRPASVSFSSGSNFSGGTPQLANSDDVYVRLQGSGQRAAQVSITGLASKAQASELRFTVEAAAVGSSTRQEIALFDYTTRTWVTVRQGSATTTDATVVVAVTDRPARFIEGGTLRLMARVTFVPSGGKKATTDARIDRAFWTRVP